MTDGIYGDQPTLRTASEFYNVDFTIISTLGAQGRTDISQAGFSSLGRIILGHFVKCYGDQYVLLSCSGTAEIESEAIDFNLEEKVELEIEDKIELDNKLEIADRIEAEEKLYHQVQIMYIMIYFY